MVMRTDTGALGASQQQGQIQQSSASLGGSDVNKFRQSNVVDSGRIQESSTDRILSHVLDAAGQLTAQGVKIDREEAYLSGVAKAGTIANEAELQGNIFTRDWQTAGYRDTMGKLADADNQATIAGEMKFMREKPPEEYSKYLADKRTTVLQSFEGMSREGRKTAFASQMMNERANVIKHGAEHYAYIIETEQKSVRAVMNQHTRNMSAAKGAGESPDGSQGKVYGAATDAAYMATYSSVYSNPKLPQNIKSQLLHEVAQSALDNDDLLLYRKIMDTAAGPGKGPMADIMDDKQQHGLSSEYRASLARTSGMRMHQASANKALIESSWSDAGAPVMSIEDVNANVQNWLGTGLVKTEKEVEAIYQAYYKSSASKLNKTRDGSFWATGNQAGMHATGVDQESGLKAWMETTGRKMSIPDAINALNTIGTQHGQGVAFKEIGRLLAPGFASIGQNEAINPAMADGMKQTFALLDAADKDGKTGAYTQFLSALSPEEQSKAVYIRDFLRKGMEPAAAISKAVQLTQDDKSMTPEYRAALTAQNAKDDVASVAQIDIKGPIGTAFGAFRAVIPNWLGGISADQQALSTKKGWFESDLRVAEVSARTKLEYAKELQLVSKTNPNMDSASRAELAMSNVAGRTVRTEGGPFTVPMGTTLASYFDVPPGNTDRIGKALDQYLAVGADNRMAITANPSGGLTFTEYNKESKVVRSGNFDPKVVNGIIEANRIAEGDKFKAERGAGVTHKDPAGVAVQFNGDNSADVANDQMLKFRSTLSKHEGVRDTPYTDLSGKVVDGAKVQTVGVGVSSHNPHYPKPGPDGKVTQEQINRSFMRASSDAAKAASRIMTQYNLSGDAAFQLTAELAYQAGTNFDKIKNKGEARTQYSPMFNAIIAKDTASAIEAIRKTQAWKMGGAVRQKHYENLLTELTRK